MKVKKVEFGDIILKKLDSNMWELWEPLRVYIKTDDGARKYHIEKGFKTDLGSIPSRAKGIVNDGTADDDLLLAFLIHDINYGIHRMSKGKADNLLFQMMKDCKGVDAWDRYIVKYALKWFGSSSWEKTDTKIESNRSNCKYEWSDK